MSLLLDRSVADPRIATGVTVAGLDPETLVRDHGSPLFLYDLDVVAARVAMLRAALPDGVEVAYAVKANPSPAILRLLAGLGLGADIASGGELSAVTRTGFDPGRVVMTGPGKTDAEIAAAIRAGVRAITIESLEEVDVLLDMASLAGRHQGLMIRLAADETGRSTEGTPIISAAGAAKFGLLPDEVDEAIDRLRLAGAIGDAGSPYQLLGLHAFGASNVREADRLVEHVRWLGDRARTCATRHGLRFRMLDAGGGLGIPYADDQEPLDVGRLGSGIATVLADWAVHPTLQGVRLVLEPGRFLVGPAGAYLMRVVRTKQRDGRTMAVTDGGIHHVLRPALVGDPHRIVGVGAAAERSVTVPASVVGPLCTGLDQLSGAVELPEPRAGDLLAVLDVGAYGFTESMPLFLSHPVPAEVVVSRGVARVARLRQEPGGGSAVVW
jgi:diaminopimelate decarboxylase